MNLIEYIENSKTWTCPKTGWWKVIAVGGGASCGYSVNNSGVISIAHAVNGGATSFGSYLTAKGGTSDGIFETTDLRNKCFSGFVSSADDVTKIVPYSDKRGYGAAGVNVSAQPGRDTIGFSGEVKTAMINFTAGDTVNCTIGAGGKTSYTAESTQKNEEYLRRMNLSTNGVIIVQFVASEV